MAKLRYHAPAVLAVVCFLIYFTHREPKLEVDPLWEKTIVSLQIAGSTGFSQHGVGFLIRTEDSPAKAQTILVTAKHLISSLAPDSRKNLAYRYRTKSGGSSIILDRDLQKGGAGDWFFHASADVACRLFGHYPDADILATVTNRFLSLGQIPPDDPVLLTGFGHDPDPNRFRPSFSKGTPINDWETLFVKAPPQFDYNGGPVIRVVPTNMIIGDTLGIAGLVSDPRSVRARNGEAPWNLDTNVSTGENFRLYPVVPTRAILELLNLPEFQKFKEDQWQKLRAKTL